MALNHPCLFSDECTTTADCRKLQKCNESTNKCECKDANHIEDTENGGCKPKCDDGFADDYDDCNTTGNACFNKQ